MAPILSGRSSTAPGDCQARHLRRSNHLRPRARYSGPQQPIVSRFVELFYASEAAKLAAMARGGSATWRRTSLPIATTDLPGESGGTRDHRWQRGATAGEAFQSGALVRRGGRGGTRPVNFSSTQRLPGAERISRQPHVCPAGAAGSGRPTAAHQDRCRPRLRRPGVWAGLPPIRRARFLTKQETINPYPFNYAGRCSCSVLTDGRSSPTVPTSVREQEPDRPNVAPESQERPSSALPSFIRAPSST